MKLSVIIPVYNEDPRNLTLLQQRLRNTLADSSFFWEILYIDDASDEKTRTALRELTQNGSQTRIVFLETRQGQETAVIRGFQEARGDWVCTMHCDLQNRPEDLKLFLDELNSGYDLILGSRQNRTASLWRKGLSRFYNLLMTLRWQTSLRDWGCGYNAAVRTVALLAICSNKPLKVNLIKEAQQWKEIAIMEDKRAFGRSHHSMTHALWIFWKSFTAGNTINPAYIKKVYEPKEI